MKRIILGLLAVLAVMIAACNSESIANDVPARIVESNQASRSELQRVVSSALNLKQVTLASDALTKTNVLIIERKSRFGLGYDLGKPKVFRLVKSGYQCVLVFQGTKKRWALRKTQCEPVKPPLTVDNFSW